MGKKIFVILFSIFFIFENAYAEYTTNVQCSLHSSEPFGLTGDVSGKRVFTKSTYAYDCNQTIIKRGTCKTWSKNIKYDIFTPNQKKNVYFQTSNFSGSIGQMLSVINVFGKLNGIWAGWHGYCIKGTPPKNFGWLTNPYFIAGAVIDIATWGAGKYFQEAGKAAKAGGTAGKEAAKEAAKKIIAYSVCAANAGINVASMLQQYNATNPCDPVDDICPDQVHGGHGPGQVFTIPTTRYNDMINQPGGSKIVKYIQILNQSKGVTRLRIINPGIGNMDAGNSAAARAAAKKVKLMVLKIQALIMTVELTACVYETEAHDITTHSGSQGMKKKPKSMASPTNLAIMGLGMINPLLGLGAEVALNMYQSFQTVDTCDNLTQAKAQGSRHVQTYHATRAGLCHFVRESTKNMGPGLKQDRFYYCCYDSKITRILAEQAKAQFALGWQHCTNISFTELEHLSFTPCGKGLNSSNNGVDFPASYTTKQRMRAYQYTHKCMDLVPLDNYIKKRFGGPNHLIDSSTINNVLKQYKYN